MVHTTRKKSKTSKHPTKVKRLIPPVPSKKILKFRFTKKSKVQFQDPVDIAKVYGKAFDLYLPEITNVLINKVTLKEIDDAYSKPSCKLDIKHSMYSARTSACLNYLKRRDVKKRVFYVFSHGTIYSSISQTPANTFLVQTGEICTITLGKWDSDLLTIFNKRNKFNTLDVFFGKYGPNGPPGQIYELLNMYAPYELYAPKYLSYSEEDLIAKRMLFGIYEKNVDTDKHHQLQTLKDSYGVEQSIDSIFATGISSTDLLKMINANYTDSINFVLEIACSVADNILDAVSYAFPLSLMNRPKFYSLDVSGHRNPLSSVKRPSGRTSPKNYKGLYKRDTIPDLSIVFLYDTYTKCMYTVRSLEQLYIFHTYYSKLVTYRKLYLGIQAIEGLSKHTVSKTDEINRLPDFDDVDYFFSDEFNENYLGKINGIYIVDFLSYCYSLFRY